MRSIIKVLAITLLSLTLFGSAYANGKVSKAETRGKVSSFVPSRAAIKSERDEAYKILIQAMKTIPVDVRLVQMAQKRLKELDRFLATMD